MNRGILTSEKPFVWIGTTLYKIVNLFRLKGGYTC